MKKIILLALILLTSLIVFAPRANAVNLLPFCNSSDAASTTVCKTAHQNEGAHPDLVIMKTVINVLSYIIGSAAIIVIIIGAIQMVFSGGSAQTVSSARNMIIYAVVGIAVAVLAQVIVVFVLKNIS